MHAVAEFAEGERAFLHNDYALGIIKEWTWADTSRTVVRCAMEVAWVVRLTY